MNEKKEKKEDSKEKKEKERIIEEINEPGVRNPTSERTQNPNYK